MTLTERLKDVRKRLDFVSEIKNLSPEDYQAVLVSIIRNARCDGVEDEREACANTARSAKEECDRIIATTDEESAYRSGAIYIASQIECHIRARSAKVPK